MNAKELAALLDGREYSRRTIDAYEAAMAEVSGLVILIGASDDNMDFHGAIRDQIGCYDGGTAYLTSAGLLTNECDDEDCPYFAKLKAQAATIEAVWADEATPYAWTYKTDIPHVTFEVLEDGFPYCRGIVFSLADVKGSAA